MSQTQIQAESVPSLQFLPNKRGMSVLIVEDDEADAYLIARALAANPEVATIMRAIDGVEALALVDTGALEPDIAFIDLSMPRKDGLHLLADFTARRQPCFPMVVLTSSPVARDAVRSRFRGAVRVLVKPDSLEDLESVLAATITSVQSGVTLPPRHRETPNRHGSA